MRGPSPSVLVVDDDSEVREMYALLLQADGYSVHQATDGQDALRGLSSLREAGRLPGLILLDLCMPRMDGPAFVAAQRKDPALRAIPVVVVSGEPHGRQQAEALGAAGYVQKPAGRELLAVVRGLCVSPP